MSQTPSNIGSFQSGSRAVIRTKTVYDANGRVVALIDDRGAQTTYQYDLLDRQTSMTFQDGSTRTSVYDLANDVTQYTDENGSVFANTYDSLGRRTATAITLATGVATTTTAQSFQYDGLSRLTQAIDGAGSTTVEVDFYYDSLGRVVEESQKLGSDTRYVIHSAFTSIPLTELTYPNGRKLTYSYDALYRRNYVNETSGAAIIAAWQFFGYRTATINLRNGITCSFMNDATTRSAIQAGQATPGWDAATPLAGDRLGYDGSGRMITKRFLPPSSSTTSLIGFTTEYDPASNKLFERALHAETRSSLYPSYDSINRLLEYQRGTLASGGESITTPIGLSGTDSQRSYDLDHLGNWKNTAYIPVSGSPATEVRRHNLMNEVTKFGTTPVLYDHGNNNSSSDPLVKARGNGNIANDGTRIYAYDALNRLTTVTRKSGNVPVAAYTYDAQGRWVNKIVTNGGSSGTIANATYRYLYDANQIIEELLVGESTATLRQFVWGQYIDELIQLKIPATTTTPPLTAGTYYPLQDTLYRTTALTDATGAIKGAYDYDAYGNTLMYSGPGTDGLWFTNDDVTTLQPPCEFLFTGRQYDPESQIYWYRARYYLPRLGRFSGRDALKYHEGSNLYEYVSGNSMTSLDPSGSMKVKEPVSLRQHKSKCGSSQAQFEFILDAKAPEEGWWVQEITMTNAYTDCDGKKVESDYHFYEGFGPVPPKKVETKDQEAYGFTDIFDLKEKNKTKGMITIVAKVSFFTNTTMATTGPSTWKKGKDQPGKGIASYDAPGTKDKPTWWEKPEEGPKERTVTITWDCCDCHSTSKLEVIGTDPQ